MLIAMVHGVIILAFLAAGTRWPRIHGGMITSDTMLNFVNGAMLAAFRATALWLIATQGSVPRCSLASVQGLAWQFMVVFLLSDFTRYWLHYAHHRFEILWRFHRVHHSSPRLDASSGLRMHIVDFVQLSLIPVVLFGVVFDCSTFDPRVWPALVILTDVFDAFQHANLGMTLRHPAAQVWDCFFNNPVFHSWHHSTNPGEYNGNYGQALTIWDRLFDTHIPHRVPALDVGLPAEERIQNTLLGMQTLRR